MNISRIKTTLSVAIIAAALAGCATPKEVHQLADKTAATVGTIGVHMRRLSQNSRDMAELRAANIARLHGANVDLRARYEFDVELTKKTGGGKNLDLIDGIEAWNKKVEEIFDKAKGEEEKRKQRIIDTQTELDAKSEALAQISQALAELAKKDQAKDRVRFLAGFAKELKGELDEALEADDEGAKNAKALLTAAKARIKDGVSKTKSRSDSSE